MAVDAEATTVDRLRAELERRYARDYRVVVTTSGADALEHLEALHDEGAPLALVLADHWLPGATGTDVLREATRLHPRTKRAMLVAWGAWADAATADAIRDAMAVGAVDSYAPKPWKSPDESFHLSVSELLNEWMRADDSAPQELTVVGDRGTARVIELRNLAARNGVPHVFHDWRSPEGQRVLAAAGHLDAPGAPVVRTLDGSVVVDPSNAQLARAYGAPTELPAHTTCDVLVIGAGPAGLATAVSATAEGLDTVVVEREAIGGQAGSSSRIRNYPGFARGVSGAELAQRAFQQAWLFGTQFLLMREAMRLDVEGDGYTLTAAGDADVRASTVVLAMGVTYRRLGVPSLERFEGTAVFHGTTPADAAQFRGAEVCIVGGGNSAGQAAVHLARHGAAVTMVVRTDSLADSMSSYLRDEIAANPAVRVRVGTEVSGAHGDARLTSLTLQASRDGSRDEVPADAVFVLIGAEPRTEWLPDAVVRDDRGFVVTGADVGSMPDGPRTPYETSLRGVYAVGDVRAGSVKRVAGAVGEGSVVVQDIFRALASR
jgi:thioredoxin reductase (NADPH)